MGEGGKGEWWHSMDGGRCLKATTLAIACSWLYKGESSVSYNQKAEVYYRGREGIVVFH